MSESPEGIGGRQWGYEPTRLGTFLVEGKTRLAEMTPEGMQAKLLIATAPQLWDAANEVLKACAPGALEGSPVFIRLANVVAKAVGKTDWKDVAQ